VKSPSYHHPHLTHPTPHTVAVYAKIKASLEKITWKPEVEEQYEDSLGNVLDKKTYEALKLQGLL